MSAAAQNRTLCSMHTEENIRIQIHIQLSNTTARVCTKLHPISISICWARCHQPTCTAMTKKPAEIFQSSTGIAVAALDDLPPPPLPRTLPVYLIFEYDAEVLSIQRLMRMIAMHMARFWYARTEGDIKMVLWVRARERRLEADAAQM